MGLPNAPITRKETYLSNIAGQNTALPAEPHTREEEYLDFIAKNGGGGGTGEGDMKKSVYDSDLTVAGAGGIKDYVTGAIADKVDKVQGKGLSTNDYDDTAKGIVDGVTSALSGKVDTSAVGAANGVASLDYNGEVPVEQIPITVNAGSQQAIVPMEKIYIGNSLYAIPSADGPMIASAFSSGDSYAVGDYVINYQTLYKCTTTHTGAWNDAHFTMVHLADEVEGKADKSAVVANTQLLKDTVGWNNKNKYDTVHGQQDIVINAQGEEVSNNGTYTTPYIPVTKNQIISYASKVGNNPVYRIAFYDSSKTFISRPYDSANNKLIELPANTAYIRLSVDNQHAVGAEAYFTDLMCRDYDILDSTYEPYRGTTAFPRDEQKMTGAYNLLIPTVASSGIVTRNADNTFTVNGTLSETTVYELGRDCLPTLEIGKTYKLVGTPSSGIPENTRIVIRPSSTSSGGKSDSGSGAIWEVTSATQASAFCYLELRAGTYSNVVFKPMLTPDLNATYDGYVKGAMTNRELTENKLSVSVINSAIDLDTLFTTGLYRVTNTSTVHRPANTGNMFTLFVVNLAGTFTQQIAIETTGTIERIYTRRYGGDPLAWSSWYKVEGTAVS